MSWFRLDDQGAFHSKVIAAGNEAYGAWCRAGQWASAHLTDGKVPRSTAFTIARPKVWTKLIDVRLCESLGDDGFQIHDFLDWNPSADEVRAKRAERAEAGRRGGNRSANVRWGDEKPQADGKQQLRQQLEQPVSNQPATAQAEGKPELQLNVTPIPIPIPYPEENHTCPASRDGRADEVWEHYVRTCKVHRPRRRPTKLTAKDRKTVNAHLASGFTVEDLKRAAEGLFRSTHHLGLNDRSTEYLEFEYALRKPATFIAIADDMVPVIEPITETRPKPEELADHAELDAALAMLDARFAS